MKKIEAWQTEDGRVFETEEAALEHDAHRGLDRAWTSAFDFCDGRPSFTEFMHGFEVLRPALLRMLGRPPEVTVHLHRLFGTGPTNSAQVNFTVHAKRGPHGPGSAYCYVAFARLLGEDRPGFALTPIGKSELP